ncbi:S16 family serine protease [Lacrimispora sp. BS-2]|uniref:endopeptidase La n=1 Tax=Lacrimispora sp. BS-2 TaxID=3151850 RepID=A0AAU7PPK3_9FIRM
MEHENPLVGMQWGIDIYQYIKMCHTLGENHFIGINGPAGIGKGKLIKQISKAIGREFISIDYPDFDGNTSFPDTYGDKNNALFYIENTAVKNGMYPNTVSRFIKALNMTGDLSGAIFVFSSNAILGTNTALNAEFRVFLYGCLSMQEKVLYAKTIIEKCQKRWNLENVHLPDNTIEILIKHYTKEAGINYLSVLIRNLYEVIYYENKYEKDKNIAITNKMIFNMLGSGCYVFDEQIKKRCLQGVGMAWTKWGGTLLPIEVAITRGQGNIDFSGNIGSLMKESVQVVFTYLKVNCSKWKIPSNYFYKHDFHINIYEQEISKDGVSAGLTFFVKLLCTIRNMKFQQPIAFSGEVSLEGRVLRIGGLKEKLCTIQEHGIKKVVLPKQSWPEYQLIPVELRNSLSVSFIDDLKELEKIILQEMGKSGYGRESLC